MADKPKQRRDPLEPVEAVPEVLAGRVRTTVRRDRSWDAQRSKATYDLPAPLIERIRDIAKELAGGAPGAKVKTSDVARLLIEAGLEQYEAGKLKTDLYPTGFTLFPD